MHQFHENNDFPIQDLYIAKCHNTFLHKYVLWNNFNILQIVSKIVNFTKPSYLWIVNWNLFPSIIVWHWICIPSNFYGYRVSHKEYNLSVFELREIVLSSE